jgi:hypothetical protein
LQEAEGRHSEEMVESHDELLMEITREMALDRIGEDRDDEEEEDADDGGHAAAPPAVAPPPPAPPAAVPKEINKEGPMEKIPEPEVPQLHLYHALMRDYEENPLRLEDDFDDLDDYPNEGCSDVDE